MKPEGGVGTLKFIASWLEVRVVLGIPELWLVFEVKSCGRITLSNVKSYRIEDKKHY